MRKRNFLKGAGVLLIAAFMIFSTAAIANTTNKNTPTIQTFGEGSGITTIGPIIWDNGLDYEGLGASQFDAGIGLDPICADDFILEEPDNTIYDVHWIGGYWNGPPDDGDFDWEVTFYADRGDGNAPGAIIFQQLFPNAETSETFIDGVPGGSNFYSYDVYLNDPLTLTPGEKYWLSVQGIGAFAPQSGWAYHSSILLHQGVFKSVYFSFPDWTDSEIVFGTAYDFCFQLTGYEDPVIPDLDCDGSLDWTEVDPGSTVTGTFTVENIGEPLSLLDWEIESYPEDWGEWDFSDESGTDLTPEDGAFEIDVEVVAPEDEETEFTGEIVLVNSNDPTDTCIIEVSLVTPVSQQLFIIQIFERLAERFPIFAYILSLI